MCAKNLQKTACKVEIYAEQRKCSNKTEWYIKTVKFVYEWTVVPTKSNASV